MRALSFQRRGLTLQVLFAQQITREQWGAVWPVESDHGALEVVFSREDRTAVEEDLGSLRHAGHDWMACIDADLEDGPRGEELVPA